MEALMVSLNAVIPFVFYLAVGYGARRLKLCTNELLQGMNKLVFKAFFPLSLFWNMYTMDPSIEIDIPLLLAEGASLIALIILLMLTVPWFVKENPRRGVVVQAIYRSNCVLFALPMAEVVMGEPGKIYATMMLAVIVPILNVSAVLVLESFHGEGLTDPKKLIINILTNPLIDGIAVGALFFALGIHLPRFIETPVKNMGSMATPLALFILGGTLEFSQVGKNLQCLTVAMGIKLLVIPLVVTVITTLAGLSDVVRFTFFIIYATPVATSSYVMAQNMGGDGELAGQFVVFSTVASALTLFIWVYAYAALGFV
ncbi:MAG: AEC family transporter [Bacillota bacterium]|nr:AEC family transporter [Bacillota bacterium]